MSLIRPPMPVGTFPPALQKQAPLTHSSSSFASSSISPRKTLASDTLSLRFEGAIHEKAKAGKVDDLKKLTINRQNVDEQDSTGKTALAHACEKGHIAVINYLAEKSADLNLPSGGKTPIQYAIDNGRTAVIQLLQKKYQVIHPNAENRNNPYYRSHQFRILA
jgi:ankyrin repeat protein